VQFESTEVRTQRIFIHIGWRVIEGVLVYLHAGGAIGPDGPIEGIQVVPEGTIANYVLPPPLPIEGLRQAIRASLELRKLTYEGRQAEAEWIIVPVRTAVYRAVLGGAPDFGLHVAGRTGIFKSELLALVQQHHGAGMNRLALPASWTSTENTLED